MMWLWLCLFIGCSRRLIQQQRSSKSALSQALKQMNGSQNGSDQLLEKFVAPVLALILLVLVWPVAMGCMYKGKRDDQREAQGQKDVVFRVRPHDLRSQTTVAVFESANFVSDPLGPLPDLPFGRLNAVWADFLARRSADAELWHFACDWPSEWGTVFKRQAYVRVSGDELSPWMLTQDEAKEVENG